MHKISDYLQWIFALAFIVGAIGLFEESVFAGIGCFLFGLTISPILWKNFTHKNKKLFRIVLPLLFLILSLLALFLF